MYKFFLLLLFLSQLSLGQSISSRMSVDACECFSSKIDQTQSEEMALRSFASICLTSLMKSMEDELKTFIDPELIKSEYEQGRELGLKLYFELQNLMISGCDSFFKFIDKAKSRKEILSPGISRNKISQLTKTINEGNDSEQNYYERAIVHYFSDDLNKAMKDANTAIRKNKNYWPAYVLKGQIYEVREDFKKAHKYYSKAHEITGSNEVLLLVTIAERKMKGQ